jgi:hypothetical protein
VGYGAYDRPIGKQYAFPISLFDDTVALSVASSLIYDGWELDVLDSSIRSPGRELREVLIVATRPAQDKRTLGG